MGRRGAAVRGMAMVALGAATAGVAHAMPVDPLYHSEIAHLVWRTVLLTSLAILAVVALGFGIGLGVRSYLYLALVVASQLLFLAGSGGELRLLPVVGHALGGNPVTLQVATLVAHLGGFLFIGHYLRMGETAPRLWKLLVACIVGLGLLAAAALAGLGGWVDIAGHALLLAGLAVVSAATVLGVRAGQRAAVFLLLCLLPLLFIVAARAVETLGGWSGPSWMDYALPGSFALSALLLIIGLTDGFQQMRDDRDRATHLARFDALTGALSRPAIEERLNALVADSHRSGHPLALVFFDIDRFKSVNDDHGHLVGDSCLRVITLRVRNRLRTYDLLGRWGGDELVVLLPDTRLGEALGVAENLRSAVNCRPLSIEGRLFDASLSLGVAELAAGETPEHFLARADASLYASKSAGRDRVTGQSHPRLVDATRREPPPAR